MKKNSQHEAYKSFIKRHVAALRNHLFLDLWKFDLNFHFHEKETDAKKQITTAEIDTNLKYYCADIDFYKSAYELWQRKKHNELIHTIIHEICHVLTEPMFQAAYDSSHPQEYTFLITIREQSTEHLAIIFDKMLQNMKYKFK